MKTKKQIEKIILEALTCNNPEEGYYKDACEHCKYFGKRSEYCEKCLLGKDVRDVVERYVYWTLGKWRAKEIAEEIAEESSSNKNLGKKDTE